jgi:hypothetical protein
VKFLEANCRYLLILFILWSPTVYGKALCEMYDWMACPSSLNGGRDSSNASAPTQSSGMQANPAALTVDRGFGAEMITYAGHYELAVVSGTGAIGGGFSTSNTEGSFFGITTTEDSIDQVERRLAKKPYESDRLTFVLAGNIFGRKKKKKRKFISANIGLIAKHNKQTGNYNGGLGLSGTLGIFNFGYARYRDDHKDKLSGEESTYYNQSLSVGGKFANVAVDYIYMESHAFPVSYVRMLTATIFAKKAMFTYGLRSEYSKFIKTSAFTQGVESKDPKNDTFMGAQYIFKKKVVLGIFYNYFLLREYSFGLSFFI